MHIQIYICVLYMCIHMYICVYIYICISDGQNLLSDNSSIISRWSEHFQSLFNTNRNEQDTAIHHIPQLPLKQELDEPLALHETIEVIVHLQCRKAAGVDGIPPEIQKCGSLMLHPYCSTTASQASSALILEDPHKSLWFSDIIFLTLH